MDYKAFYDEIANWIMQVNGVAMKHGMESDEFWAWVTQSIGDISKHYGNNKLVIAQMTMLFNWLEEVYAESKRR